MRLSVGKMRIENEEERKITRNRLMYDSLTAQTPPKSSLHVFLFLVFFSRLLSLSQTHIHTSSFPSSFMICSPGVVSTNGAFDIHGYACSKRADCMLKKVVLLVRRLSSLSPFLALSSFDILHDTFIHWCRWFAFFYTLTSLSSFEPC